MVEKYLLVNTGKNVKRLLKEKGYPQDAFAYDVLCVDPVTLRRWLAHGFTNINDLIRIAEYFNVFLEELFQ